MPFFLSELECIGLQVHEDLLDPFLIRLNHHDLLSIVFLWKSFKLADHLDFFGLSLIELYCHDIFDASLDVKLFDDSSELASFQLGVPEDILDVQK